MGEKDKSQDEREREGGNLGRDLHIYYQHTIDSNAQIEAGGLDHLHVKRP